MKYALRWASLPLALAACASSRAGEGDELARQLAGSAAGEPRSCVPAGAGAGLAIVAPGVVGVRRGETLWISRLGPACAGMRATDTLLVEAEGGRYCRGDRVRTLATGSSLPGPACILSQFIPYRRTG